jgi:predicted ATPase
MKSLEPPLLKDIKLKNLLSFGSIPTKFTLNNLNVIIGTNGSGKSNLIDAISLLQAAPSALAVPIRKGGGVYDWIWKGANGSPVALMEVITPHAPTNSVDLRYQFSFTTSNQRFELVDERLENKEVTKPKQPEPYFYYRYQNNQPVLNNAQNHQRILKREDVDPEQSILSQRKDPDLYPELTWLGKQFEAIRIYREWSFGRKAILRQPQSADAPNDYLLDDCSNLGLVLNKLRGNFKAKKRIMELMSQFYEGIDDFDVKVEGGTVQLFFQEEEFMIPATRLSDGTLRFLCLLAILCNPNPSSLICIEEPELGIHTDIIPIIANLLIEASKVTQIIVTTHSDVLVDALTDTPESILVCEKHMGSTQLKRLKKDALKEWLVKYSLGELWRRGEIGGNRW